MVQRIAEFDLWRPGYGGAVVSIYVAGTTTLASVYTDEALTVPAANPQTLSAIEMEGGVRYGKFAAPLYTNQSYWLSIDGIENTGTIRPPINTLAGENASAATVLPTGSTYPVTLAAAIGRQVNVANFGVFVAGSGGVAATNTATMNLAIAALSGGGIVSVPVGLYKVNSFNVPEGVIIQGQGVDATILESILGAESFILTGDRSGFRNITLDGNSLSTGSIGIKSEGNDYSVFDSVKITRFETGMYFYGGRGFIWNNLSVINTETACKLFGEDAVFEDCSWIGGLISTATTVGLSLSYEDQKCQNITLIGVGFEDCTEYALNINGAQSLQFVGCWWNGNTKTVNIIDDTAVLTPATQQDNDSIIIQFIGGRIDGGLFTATGTCQNLVLKNMKLKSITFDIDTPISNYLVLENCYEESGVVLTGETTRVIRSTTSQNGASFGVTTSATATKAWGIPLAAGQQVYMEAKVIAKGRNLAQRAIYHIGCGAYRPGDTLAYDTQTANFTAGTILTGASSGATARIQADSDSGTTGTLTLTDIVGAFLDNEIITDSNGSPGSATVNGTLTAQAAVLDTPGNVNIRTAYETTAGFAAAFVPSAQEVELQVTGAASNTLEWTVDVTVVST